MQNNRSCDNLTAPFLPTPLQYYIKKKNQSKMGKKNTGTPEHLVHNKTLRTHLIRFPTQTQMDTSLKEDVTIF